MSICVNKSHPEFKALVEQSGESSEFVAIKVADYFNTTGETDSMPTLEDIGLSKVNVVNYSLKAVNIIQNNLSIVNKWFTQLKNTPTFWSKLQQDLQVPKEQVNLLRESEGTTIEEKLASFAANYSHTVEINTAKNGKIYEEYPEFDEQGFPIENSSNLEEKTIKGNTQYYSNLTVPGGTNGSYREVNIESPLITLPKSHAQFNAEHTLMFARMDDAQTYSEKDIEKLISLMENNEQLEIKCD